MADEIDHDNFEQRLEEEVAQATNNASITNAVVTELGNVFVTQFTALSEHLQQGFSSLERTMTQAKKSKRKRSSSSTSSSESESSSAHSHQGTSAKRSKQAKTSTKDELAAQVDDLLNVQEGDKSDSPHVINTAQDGVLNEISQELDCDELCSPPLLDKLTAVVNKMLRTRLSEDKLKEKQKLYTRPQNCETLVTTRVNAEVWSKLQSHTRSIDIRLQKVQALLLKGIVPILQIANTQMSNGENQKETTRQALDAISLLSQANQELNQRRRELIKPDLNEKYQQICAEHVPCTEHPFGDDLHKTLQEITATNRVGQQVSGPPIFKKTSSNRSKNERGRWQYPPRHFQKRRGGGRKKQTH